MQTSDFDDIARIVLIFLFHSDTTALCVEVSNDLIQQANSFYLAGKECQVYILAGFSSFFQPRLCLPDQPLWGVGLLAAASKRCGKHANSQYESK